MRAITSLNNMSDLRSVVVVEVETWLRSCEMIDLKRWAYSKVERGWVEAAYIYDACDGHYKHICDLKDVDDKFVDSTFSRKGGCYGTRCRVRRRLGWGKVQSKHPHALENL